MSQSADDLFADRPSTVFIEGVGEVPVLYTDTDGHDASAGPLPAVDPQASMQMAAGIEWQAVGEGYVLWNRANTTSHVLDQTAGLLWQCMDGTGTVSEILADVADAFSVPVEQVYADFEPVVAAWVRDEFLVDPSTAPTTDTQVAHGRSFLVDPPND